MRDARAVAIGAAAALVLTAGACTAGAKNDPPVPDEHAQRRATDDALDCCRSHP